ncbi:cytochrome P450 [Methylomonas sp. AM2-LC]|uniref:cytochrome P450 n=1 Tax=Methylomonas sp. AM2-LC TaxID=3153301 RepID=UPI003263C905
MIELLKLATDPGQALINIKQKRGQQASYKFFGKDLFFISNWKTSQKILELEGAGKVGRNFLYNAKKPTFGDGLFNSHGETWANQRRMVQPFFSKNGIEQWEGVFVSESMKTVQSLTGLDQGSNVDMSLELKSLIQRILIGVMFGSDDYEYSVDQELISSIDIIVEGLFPSLLAETLGKGYLKHFFFLQNKRTDNAIRYFHSYVMERISTDNDGSLATLLAKTKDRSGCPMSQKLLLDEAITIFLAGQDSTVNTLIWFFYLIGQEETIYEKIESEINEIDGTIGFDAINKLNYTKAALYETMRLYPQALALARDTDQGIDIDGRYINPGSSLIISIYAMHRDPAVWANPFSFVPERFLEEQSEAQKGSFMPFGAGMHNCVGKYFAEAEMLIIIASIIKHVRLDISRKLILPKISITLKPGNLLTAIKR